MCRQAIQTLAKQDKMSNMIGRVTNDICKKYVFIPIELMMKLQIECISNTPKNSYLLMINRNPSIDLHLIKRKRPL